jgi:hypothetical protein
MRRNDRQLRVLRGAFIGEGCPFGAVGSLLKLDHRLALAGVIDGFHGRPRLRKFAPKFRKNTRKHRRRATVGAHSRFGGFQSAIELCANLFRNRRHNFLRI